MTPALWLLLPTLAAPAQGSQLRLADSLANGVVRVETLSGTGSGFAVGTHDGGVYFVTNQHVVMSAIGATLWGPGWLASDSRVVFVAPQSDLALIRVERFNNENLSTSLPYVEPYQIQPFALGEPVKSGQPIWLLGFSYGMAHTEMAATRGVVLRTTPETWVSARASPGNSGGPAVDQSARVVGVLSKGLVGAAHNENGIIGVDDLKAFLNASRVPLSQSPLARPLNEVAPDIERHCVLVARSGVRRVGFGFPVEVGEDELLLASDAFGARVWEYSTRDGGVGRFDGGAPPADWACTRGIRSSFGFQETGIWRLALPRPWSLPREAHLVKMGGSDPHAGLTFDATGAVARGILPPNIRTGHFQPRPSALTYDQCTVTARLSFEVEATVRIEVDPIGGPVTSRTVTVPAAGGTISETLVGCEKEATFTRIAVEVIDADLPDWGEAALFGGGHARPVMMANPIPPTRTFLRIPESRGKRPTYLCPDGLIDAAGQRTPLSFVSPIVPSRHPSGVVIDQGSVLTSSRGYAVAQVPNPCRLMAAQPSGDLLKGDGFGALRRWSADASIEVALPRRPGQSPSLEDVMALDDGSFEVLTAFQDSRERYSLRDGGLTPLNTYRTTNRTCVLWPGGAIFCEGGPVEGTNQGMSDGRTSNGELVGCFPIREDCSAPRAAQRVDLQPRSSLEPKPRSACSVSSGTATLLTLLVHLVRRRTTRNRREEHRAM